ncbi:unannotated protein [freshwater metagenome]|uniref:Unannotated protein n=1 Tax=freshwater metagenome TaxID=449393 RepID=A0A6J6FYS4_9ZZZZ
MLAPVNNRFNNVKISETGVAVTTNKPKPKRSIKIGIASIEVTSAISGVETPYPIQPPPPRIAVAPVPFEPLNM